MKLPKHLYRHPLGAFYFVLTIPKGLQGHFEGFPRVRYSLGTKDPRQARIEAYRHTAYWLERFHSLQGKTIMTQPKLGDVLAKLTNGDASEMVVATKTAFISQAKTREERELDLEEIGRLEEEGVKPIDLFNAQNPPAKKPTVIIRDGSIPDEVITLQEAGVLWENTVKALKNVKTQNKKTAAFHELKQFLGPNTKLYKVKQKDLLSFKHHLINTVGNEINTVHFKFNDLIQFFKEMKSSKLYLTENPAQGISTYTRAQKNKKTMSSKYLAFEPHEIEAIFKCENFAKIKTPHLYWGTILAYFYGMRASEIAQLRLYDVIADDGMFINISEANSDQSLKTIYSERRLPLHPHLIEIGFLEYKEEVAKLGSWQLFPNIKKNPSNGFGTRLSNDFSEYLQKIGIKADRKSLHSFRSNITQVMSRAKVEAKYRQRWTGHEVEGINYNHYDEEVGLEHLRENCIPHITHRLPPCIRYQQGMFDKIFKRLQPE